MQAVFSSAMKAQFVEKLFAVGLQHHAQRSMLESSKPVQGLSEALTFDRDVTFCLRERNFYPNSLRGGVALQRWQKKY
jgi:hypothetical protein